MNCNTEKQVVFCCLSCRKIQTFVQGESRSQVYLDYAEPPPKVHLYERIFRPPHRRQNRRPYIRIFLPRKTQHTRHYCWYLIVN